MYHKEGAAVYLEFSYRLHGIRFAGGHWGLYGRAGRPCAGKRCAGRPHAATCIAAYQQRYYSGHRRRQHSDESSGASDDHSSPDADQDLFDQQWRLPFDPADAEKFLRRAVGGNRCGQPRLKLSGYGEAGGRLRISLLQGMP